MADRSTSIGAPPGAATAAPMESVTLDTFALAAAGRGVAVSELAPLTCLVVQTRNTRYRIIVSGDREVLIDGGAIFPEPTPAHLEGATAGGSLLKVGWIGIGLRMEIRAGGRRIVTTPVASIALVEADGSVLPH